ncbi:Rapamycin-insensitive companion of mTOR [Hypsibius exemplaris]|uniref:Rapamycin-insensitive companion of mTOR n=1 Tax=Hypsibius exemplaris TaxID=2072580 RepID=A0A1W0WK51_HYPEX|nr:Rapamycin-insensitive companion of mTOR [Hypsibius exemplaris]
MASRARFRARQASRKPAGSASTDPKSTRSIAEEPKLNLAGRNWDDVYKLTLLDSANLKRSIAQRLSQLNHLVRFRRTAGSLESNGVTFSFFRRLIVVGLCDASKEIRGATFRVIRHHISSLHHCDDLLASHVDFYIARAFDLSLDNEMERLQALLLTRKMIQLGHVPSSIVNALTAIAAEGGEERERMSRICLETLCEMLVYCPEHPNIIVVLRTLMDFLMESNSVPLTTAVVASIARFSARSGSCIPPMFCDIAQILHPVTAFEGIEENNKPEAKVSKAVMIQAAKNAVVAAFRTWEGLHLLTASSSGIRSLVGILFLSNQLAQEAVLDIVSHLLYLPADFESPSRSNFDTWSLQENFVADEARALLPHISRTRVNLCANYLAVLLFIFHQNGLIDALVHVISADGKFHQRAFHLLNSYLALANVHLPAEFTSQMQSLHSLVSLATNLKNLGGRVQGADTLADLLRSSSNRDVLVATAHGITPSPSIYLEHVITLASNSVPASPLGKDGEGNLLLRDAVSSMTNHEFISWNWPAISTLLKAKAVHTEDAIGYKFFHRLLFFFKPSNKLFSNVPQKNDLAVCYSRCGCLFLESLITEAPELVEELMADLYKCLSVVKDSPNSDPIFNPLKLFSSCAADYFIFIGRLSSTVPGQTCLHANKLLDLLLSIVTQPDVHESYVKLVISTLYYGHSEDRSAQDIFEKIIVLCSPSVRCYAALHLRTLLRCRMPGFCPWGMERLIAMTSDLNAVVARTAVDIIDEACDEKANLEAFVHARLSLDHLSPMAEFLTARVLGTVCGFNDFPELVTSEVEKWRFGFNRKYATVVEELLNARFLSSELSDDMFHRHSSSQNSRILPEIFVPEHLYGQLVRHPDGCDLVRMEIPFLLSVIKDEAAATSALDVKAALWALGHIGRTAEGMALLSEVEALDLVVRLVAEHSNVSVRGTAFFVIGLWSTTERGADLLKSRDWLAVRHDRHEAWPLVDQRVQYRWEDSSDWMGPSTLGQNSSSLSKPEQILSYTSLPHMGDVRSPSPLIPFDTPFAYIEPAGCNGIQQHKTSRGESGFESSDGGGGLLDSTCVAPADHETEGETRQVRCESAKTDASDFSNSSLTSPSEARSRDLSPRKSTSPEQVRSWVGQPKKRHSPFGLIRSKSGIHGSVDEVVTRPHRSETRNSFREITNSIKQVVRKRHSHHLAPFPSSPTPDVMTATCFVSRPLGESSAKEEKFVGISLPVRRSVWTHLRSSLTTSALIQRDVPCLHGYTSAGDEGSQSGLEIHSTSNCLVCFVAGQDLSLTDRDSPLALQRREILRFIWILATPLGHKAAEQGILQLKNQCPVAFSDPCLYTEVCHLLASLPYKLSIRRLIQELFLDVPIQNGLYPYLEDAVAASEAALDTGITERDS